MLFDVVRTKTKEVCTVYSVQMAMAQNLAGQPAPIVLFLIYNKNGAGWELVEASEFEPVGAGGSKKPITGGSDLTILK